MITTTRAQTSTLKQTKIITVPLHVLQFYPSCDALKAFYTDENRVYEEEEPKQLETEKWRCNLTPYRTGCKRNK